MEGGVGGTTQSYQAARARLSDRPTRLRVISRTILEDERNRRRRTACVRLARRLLSKNTAAIRPRRRTLRVVSIVAFIEQGFAPVAVTRIVVLVVFFLAVTIVFLIVVVVVIIVVVLVANVIVPQDAVSIATGARCDLWLAVAAR